MFNVTALHPKTNKPAKFLSITRDRISINGDGVMVFRYNSHFPECPVVSLETLTADQQRAEDNYFKQFGSKGEF